MPPADQAPINGKYQQRAADWRNGAAVYQVLVDRFAPSADLAAKRHLYPAPKRLRSWDELPESGPYVPEAHLYAHEIDFWGGDLASTRAHLDHVAWLGADVLYLNPIHLAYTNHRYDALDYAAVSPELGTRADVALLAQDLHGRGMRLVLDGVFNHMGRNAPVFQAALSDPNSPLRDWFAFGEQFPGGARSWDLAENLPELVLETPAVREHIWGGPDSVVRSYLRDGVDGWRLDVAFEIGYDYLAELTEAAHAERAGSLVLGEVANYPADWFPALDGVLAFPIRAILLDLAAGRLGAAHAQRMLERIYADADFEHMLKSWIYLDNHDTPRLATTLPEAGSRRLAQVLAHTLPGSINLYYGSEVAMPGGDDPEMRAPMRWDLVRADNEELQLVRTLLALRRDHPALRVGDLDWLVTDRLLGYTRHTDRIADLVVVVANPSDQPIAETVLVPDSKLMDRAWMLDLLGGPQVRVDKARLLLELPAHGVAVLAPVVDPPGGYTPFKRVP